MLVLWFRASACFRFWSKTFRKHCSNNSLLSRDKSLSCLIWLVTCFLSQNMFWKNINCFRFWWKTYPKCCTSSYVISRIKSFLHLHFAVGQVLSISGYNLENETWRWKSRFWFCPSFVYFADLKPFILRPISVVAASCFNYLVPCGWF